MNEDVEISLPNSGLFRTSLIRAEIEIMYLHNLHEHFYSKLQPVKNTPRITHLFDTRIHHPHYHHKDE